MSALATRLLQARALLEKGDLAGADAAYAEVLAIEPAVATALRARAEIAIARNDAATAIELVRESLGPALATVPSRAQKPVCVLQFGSIHPGAHANTDRVLDPSWTQTTTLLVEKWDPAWPLPAHDIIVNAIADADICSPALELAAHLASTSRAPVVNSPERVLATSRVENAERLNGIEGLRVARTQRVTKERVALHGTMPYLLRAPGFHNGANFEMIADRQQEAAALATLPGDELLVIDYLETRGADGAFRKYRAMAVDGVLYPAHLAIGEVWKLHYFSASMNDARRAEEALYLANMRAHLGERAYQTLTAVVERIGLDYCGMDFTVDAAGAVAVFEANASMTVYLPDDTPENAYRREAVLAVDAALKSAIRQRVAAG